MKNFLPSEHEILNQFTKQVYARFYKTRFGIKGCSDDKCFDLGLIRYELLKHQQMLDPYDSMTAISAGVDKRIQLPTTSLTVTGIFTGTDTLDSILWTQIAGDPVTIVSPTSLTTEITGLTAEGDYRFNIQVITYSGLILEDYMEVTVLDEEPATELIQWGFSTTNPYVQIMNTGIFSFQFERDFYPGTNVFTDLDFTDDANEKYLVLKEPIGTTIKTAWFNTSFNFGSIPDQVFRTPVTLSGYRYYVSRAPVFLGVGTTKITFE